MFEGFVHPGLAAGALLAGVPLLIHLLNRQRHKPLPWAAMRFVLAAYRRTRRRAQLENLLLLLLRMGAVALLALALARPFTGKESPLAPWTETRRDVALVLDGSASTGYREGVESVHDRVLGRAREILDELDATRGDRVRLIHAAGSAELLPSRSPEDALAALTGLSEPTDEPLDLPSAMAQVLELAEEEAAGGESSTLEVRVLSDLQRRSFSAFRTALAADEAAGPDEASADAGETHPLLATLDRLAELGVSVAVEDLGAAELTPPNLGVERLRPLVPILGAGLSSEIGVTVRNHGPEGKAAVRVALSVDGERLPSRTLDVGARKSAEVVFPVVFAQSGFHALEAEIEGDRLAADDRRASVVHVPRPTRVLLVDGDPRDRIDEDEVGYWRTVLEPPDDGPAGLSEGYAPFRARTVTAAAFESTLPDLDEVDVCVLANVGPLSPSTFELLERFVAEGGALIVTLGDRDANASALEAWNARGWRADGTGLLPARLKQLVEVRSRREAYHRVGSFDLEHPALRFFADERWQPLLTEVPIYAFVSSEPVAGARVLARLDDLEESPLLVERPYDRGRVFLWTTSADADWNRIPESPGTLIPLVHELVRYAGEERGSARNVSVGAPLIAEVEAFPRGVVLATPDGARRPLTDAPEELADDLWRLPKVEQTPRAGVYRIELEGESDVLFAVRLDAEEGDLERIPAGELEAEHPAWHVATAAGGEAADDAQRPERGELWRQLAALALAFLIGETLWAAWVGRSRRRT